MMVVNDTKINAVPPIVSIAGVGQIVCLVLV